MSKSEGWADTEGVLRLSDDQSEAYKVKYGRHVHSWGCICPLCGKPATGYHYQDKEIIACPCVPDGKMVSLELDYEELD